MSSCQSTAFCDVLGYGIGVKCSPRQNHITSVFETSLAFTFDVTSNLVNFAASDSGTPCAGPPQKIMFQIPEGLEKVVRHRQEPFTIIEPSLQRVDPIQASSSSKDVAVPSASSSASPASKPHAAVAAGTSPAASSRGPKADATLAKSAKSAKLEEVPAAKDLPFS